LITFWVLAVKVINREMTEANIGEMREADGLLGGQTQDESPEIISHA
jgi:hypothetical protein